MYLPEGQRTEQVVAVWTDTLLKTAHAPNGQSADVIQYGEYNFEVMAVYNWSESGKIWKVLAVKQGQ
jgi:hypothetical protein